MTPRLLSLALLLMLSLPAIAQQPQNEIAVSAGYSSLGDLGSAPAFGLSYTRFWTDAFAIRFGAFTARGDINGRSGTKTASAYHASAEYHFSRNARFSPYVGAGLALAVTSIDGAAFDFSATETNPEVILNGGVDWNVSRRFAVGADLRYMYYDVGLGSAYQVDPATLLVSAKYRY